MSLSESRALTGVHPALAERVRYMGELIHFWGGQQIYFSGFRTFQEQERLWNKSLTRPVAPPGCSQHQYGFAVDLGWFPIINFADDIQLSPRQTNDLMTQVGQALGLTAVEGDTGHFQVFAGSLFKNWAVRSGFCDPNLTRPLTRVLPSFPHPDGQVVTNSDGSKQWVWHTTR